MSLRIKTKTYRIRDSEKKEPKAKQSPCSQAVREFCEDTTLHGFKYLVSKHYYDRVGWLVCCCASACCASVLCSVLWARFLQVPALLTLRDLRGQQGHARMPLVAVCPSAESVAYYFVNNLSVSPNVTDRLPIILSHVLRRKKTPKDQLAILEDILEKNNLSFPEALMRVTPQCRSIVLSCRWQVHMIRCEELFTKVLTDWGACCICEPYSLELNEIIASRLEVTRKLSIAVQCSDQSAFNGCEFYTKYHGEEWVSPTPLTPGYSYLAHITFTQFVDSDPEKLTEGTCIIGDDYSRSRCLSECREKHCGCLEPLRNNSQSAGELPPCAITRLNCLRAFDFEKNYSCNCLPACKKVFTYMALESSPMNAFDYTYDEIYTDLNASISSVLRIAVRLGESQIFVVHPTETWITLLSSLGGVFNMFLGVGLFSALEMLFLIFVRLPIALRSSTSMTDAYM